MKKVQNARIISARLGGWDDGYTMLTYTLGLEVNGGVMFYGNHNLGGKGDEAPVAEDILELLKVAEAKDWCDLRGRFVRIEYEEDEYGGIGKRRLGHIVEDEWHDFEEIYANAFGGRASRSPEEKE